MGEYTDMEMEQGFNEWLDDGCPPWNPGYGGEPVTSDYDEIGAETKKAWLIDGKWYPKSLTTLNKKNKTKTLPFWLSETKRIE
jgi:hypothetical protein